MKIYLKKRKPAESLGLWPAKLVRVFSINNRADKATRKPANCKAWRVPTKGTFHAALIYSA